MKLRPRTWAAAERRASAHDDRKKRHHPPAGHSHRRGPFPEGAGAGGGHGAGDTPVPQCAEGSRNADGDPGRGVRRLYDHSPIHHIEYRIKTLDSIIDKLRRRGLEVSIDNIYAHIQDVAGIRVICNYLDDIYYLRSLLTRSESYTVLREVDYIKEPKDTGYRSLHLIVNVPFVISEGTMVLPVEIQLRTIAMDMWASLEHELRYKSDRKFTQQDAARLRLCSDAISEIDREMQDIYQGNEPQYHA